MSASVNHIEELLQYVGQLFNDLNFIHKNEWPKTYATALSTMKTFDYVEPIPTDVCFSHDHPMHWYKVSENENECPDCENKPSIRFYYMSLSEKIKKWTRSPKMCEKMLGH